MTDALTQLSLVELLIRVVVTFSIVIAVTTTVGRLGPVAGGLVAGLPIGLGPGFFFLLENSSAGFLQEMAVHSLLALSATQLFLLSYMVTARHGPPLSALATAIFVWWASVWALKEVPANLGAAIGSFALITLLARKAGSRFVVPDAEPARKEGFAALLLRAAAGGLLVALVTLLASSLGAVMSGFLLAFPIGYALISLTVHERFGVPTVTRMVFSALFGTISLATFCVALAYLLDFATPETAFIASLIASVGMSGLMVIIVQLNRSPKGNGA